MTHTPKPAVHVCCLCADNGAHVTAVGAQEAASGPGQVLYACPDCAPSVRAVFAIGDN
ncbi:hypothetical protein ATKI12_5797 [Kitasatospora sp. Ki12]